MSKKSTTVTLSTPIKGSRGETIKDIVLREPRYSDFMELGLPFIYVSNEGGGGWEQESAPTTRAWIERLADIDPNLLELLDLTDTFALRGAVYNFFRDALKPKSTAMPDSSSSDEAGTFVPSVL